MPHEQTDQTAPRLAALGSLLTAALMAGAVALSFTPAAVAADDEALMQAIRESARIAGAARYCEVEEDMLDDYISRAEGRIAGLSQDDYEKVMARIEFKNLTMAATAKAPTEGCEAFVRHFEALLRAPR